MEELLGNEKSPCVIIELGAKYTKIGFALESDPRKIFPSPSFFDTDEYLNCSNSNNSSLSSHLNICNYLKDLSAVKYSIEEFIQYIFVMVLQIKKIQREKNYICLLLLDFQMKQKEKMRKIYEEISRVILSYPVISTLKIAPKNIFPIYTSGFSSGIIVKGGYLRTMITAINNGVEISNYEIDFGSSHLEKTLKQLILNDKEGISFILSKPEQLDKFSLDLNQYLDDILVRCLVIVNKDLANTILQDKSKMKGERDYTKISCYKNLPQFQLSFLNRVIIGEKLFDEVDEYNFAYQVLNFIQMKIPNELRKKLCQNIVLSGGMTMLYGFYQRFNEELKVKIHERDFEKLKPLTEIIKVHKVIYGRNYLSWIGASLIMNSEKLNFAKYQITKDDNGILDKEVTKLFS